MISRASNATNCLRTVRNKVYVSTILFCSINRVTYANDIVILNTLIDYTLASPEIEHTG